MADDARGVLRRGWDSIGVDNAPTPPGRGRKVEVGSTVKAREWAARLLSEPSMLPVPSP